MLWLCFAVEADLVTPPPRDPKAKMAIVTPYAKTQLAATKRLEAKGFKAV